MKTFLKSFIVECDRKKVNLEYLNHFVRYKYFEIESLSDALIKQNLGMTRGPKRCFFSTASGNTGLLNLND